MLESLKWFLDDLRWSFWKKLQRCPQCHGKEIVACCGTGCVNQKCQRFDSCVAIEKGLV